MQPDDDDVSPRSRPNVITADPDRSGMLPPPPERFPQRAAPSQPKPVKRAAATPPKSAPLPKPKPAPAKAETPPPQQPESPAPANKPADAPMPN